MEYLYEPRTILIHPSHNQNFALVESESFTQSNSERIATLTTKILKATITGSKGIHPRRFCRRWFGLETVKESGRPRFLEEQILAMESEHGYREKCINLLAKLLKIKPNTIHRWGKGVSFEKMPVDKKLQYKVYLGYIDSIRVISASLTELDENSLLRLLQRLKIE